MSQLDFTLERYRELLLVARSRGRVNLRFDEYLGLDKSAPTVLLIRHDVDRFPTRALRMAKLEEKADLKASYYFRKSTFDESIVRQIADSGHEIGYHYECLSDSDGNVDEALRDFKVTVENFRKVAPVKTVAMHGAPFSRWNNLDLLRDAGRREELKKATGILGDVVHDIDYSGIAFVSDTGRNFQNQNNYRDRVAGALDLQFADLNSVIAACDSDKLRKLCIQFHPERWNSFGVEFILQLGMDLGVNTAKKLLRPFRK